MKKMKFFYLLLFVTSVFIACQKEQSVRRLQLDASKSSSIKRGEPVLFTLSQVNSRSAVNWSVSPSANSLISSNGNQASIKFGLKGSYTVTALFGDISASREVVVSDTIITGGGGDTLSSTLPLSTGEVININVTKVDTGAGSGLLLSAITANSYRCLNNSLLSTFSSGMNSFVINYTGVYVPADCGAGTARAAGFNSLFPVSEGSNSITINFGGTSYTGTILKAGSSYTISWPYTTGVTISPAIL